MPARVSRSSVPPNSGGAKGKTAKNKSKKRSLDAYSRAEKLVPEARIAKHRLGQFEDDGPRQKRRRHDSDEDDDADEDDEDEGPRRKRPAQRRVNDPDAAVEYGSDSSGNEWTMGGLAEDDEDSDLDSDEAFGDSDEEKFEGFTFRGSKNLKGKKSKGGRTPKRKNFDLNEKEQDDDDSGDSQDEEGLGFGDDAIDLAAMLDQPMSEDDAPAEGSGSGSEDDEEYDSESESESEDDDDADDEEKAARMRDRLEALEPKSRRDQPAISSSGADVDMNDLFAEFAEDVAPVADKSKKAKKRAQQVVISAPLPKRQQDRIEREVATAKAKETLDRWKQTVIQNRRAEHLTFPLQHPDDTGITVGKEKFTPATQGAPANELEASIQRIMEESGLATQRDAEGGEAEDEEVALLKAEGLAERHIDVDEVMRRRAELRKQRALLFREEIKAKRIAKIKSKSYRRVHRRERERAKEQENLAMGGLDYDAMDEDAKEKHDRQRAEARMSTRHKDSKWAKSLKQTNRTAWDDGARDGAVEQARRNEELKKRMAGKDVSDDEGSLSPDSEDDDEDITHEKLNLLQRDAQNMKGLAGLKFMQQSDEKRRRANDEDVERIRRELAIADGDEVESEEEEEGLGRAIFGPASKAQNYQVRQKQEFEAPEDSDEEADAEDREAAEAGIVVDRPQTKSTAKPKSILKNSTATSGPLAKAGFKPNEPTDSGKAYGGWLSSGSSKAKRANAAVDADTITPSSALPAISKATKAGIGYEEAKNNTSAGNTNGWTTVSYKTGADDEDVSDAEPTNAILTPQEEKISLQERAFAGDDVVAAFEAEKAEMVDDEDEKEVSNHLPGWGTWTGEGLSKSVRKFNKKAAHNPLYKTKVAGVRANERKDAGMDRVIVSEKQDRKGKKYLATQLPHEFETKEQYERSRRLPMGPEWTTKVTHQKMTRPRVLVKRGVNVEALGKPIA